MTVELLLGIAMGFIPYVDNFGTCLLILPVAALAADVFRYSTSRWIPDGSSRWNVLLSDH